MLGPWVSRKRVYPPCSYHGKTCYLGFFDGLMPLNEDVPLLLRLCADLIKYKHMEHGEHEIAIEEAESSDISEQNMDLGRTAHTIAGKMKYGALTSDLYYPFEDEEEISISDYLLSDYSKEVLDDTRITDEVKEIYRDLIADNPFLKAVKVVSTPDCPDDDGGFMANAQREVGNDNDASLPCMEVLGNFGEIDDDKEVDDYNICDVIITDRLAMALGCDPEIIVKNAKLRRDLIFLHEFGHANSYLRRYVMPLYRNYRRHGNQNENSELSVIPRAIFEFDVRENTKEDMGMLVPDGIKPNNHGRELTEQDMANFRDALEKRFCGRFVANEVYDRDSATYENEKRYRQREEERIADEFATEYVIKHHDRYFDESVLGKPVDISEFFDADLNLRSGQYLSIKDRKYGTVSSGYLLQCPYLGEDLLLSDNSDLDDLGSVTNYGVIERVVCDQIEDGNGRKHQRLLLTTSGGEFIMSKPLERAKTITKTVEDLTREFGLKKGEELQLLSLYFPVSGDNLIDEEDDLYDKVIGAGGIIYGKMLDDLKVGEPIYLGVQLDDDGLLYEWKSWPIESIERRWQTWQINTKLGDKRASYEVLPLLELPESELLVSEETSSEEES